MRLTPVLTLYATPLSANARKVLAVVRHLGLDVVVHEVNVYAGDGQRPGYLAINPSGQVPTLVDEGVALFESNAILVHLAEVHGDGALWSRDPRERATIVGWLFWEAAQWQPALVPVLSAHVGHRLLPDARPKPDEEPHWDDPKLVAPLRRLEGRLSQSPFLAGVEASIADFSVAGMTTYFRRCGFPFGRYTAISAWHARIEALEAWRETATALWG